MAQDKNRYSAEAEAVVRDHDYRKNFWPVKINLKLHANVSIMV